MAVQHITTAKLLSKYKLFLLLICRLFSFLQHQELSESADVGEDLKSGSPGRRLWHRGKTSNITDYQAAATIIKTTLFGLFTFVCALLCKLFGAHTTYDISTWFVSIQFVHFFFNL